MKYFRPVEKGMIVQWMILIINVMSYIEIFLILRHSYNSRILIRYQKQYKTTLIS